RARGGAADADPTRVAPPDGLRHRRSAEDRRDAELVAAGEEDPRRGLELAHQIVAPGIAALEVGQRLRAPRAQLDEELLVALTRVGQLRGRGDDGDDRVVAVAELDEAPQDLRGADLVLA